MVRRQPVDESRELLKGNHLNADGVQQFGRTDTSPVTKSRSGIAERDKSGRPALIRHFTRTFALWHGPSV